MPNPFLEPSPLPHRLPPFADIRDEHYAEAFRLGMEEQLREIRAITRRRDAPMFENTFPALESSGQLLGRVSRVFDNATSADSTPATDALEEELAPLRSAHHDAILLDTFLYHRVRAVWEQLQGDDAPAHLTDEDRYLVHRWYTEMTLAGAGLDDEAKQRLTAINAEIATLTTRFEKNLLADTNDLAVHVLDPAELDGLEAGGRSATARAAAERGLDGHLIPLVLPTGHPYLAALRDRGLRQRIMTASRSRGCRGGVHDNSDVLLRIVRLRAERAELLGYGSHAAWVLADETAKSPAAVAELLGRLAPVAARNARAEKAELERINPEGESIESWDWAFYTEKVRAAQHDVDTSALRPWFEAERVLRDGVFGAATALYGIRFAERDDLVAYHPDVRVFEVTEHDGAPVGLYLLDLYTRDSKRGGAWMNDLVGQNDLLGQTAVVVNNLNVPRPAPGEPTLLTFDEVSTLFHEFGHALHGLLARVTYPRFSGTSVFRDFVEFPSQVNEMWMLWPEVLERYAVHHETGEPIDADAVQRIRDSETFNEGFATSEYLAAALLDQAWHGLSRAEADAVTDVAAFEAAALAAAGLDDPAVPPRYASTYFAHTFAGGYDAGYYAYIWSEVLDADAVEWFRENGGLTRANGDRFREHVLGVGGSRDGLEAYRAFRGRDAVIDPLLRRRGLE